MDDFIKTRSFSVFIGDKIATGYVCRVTGIAHCFTKQCQKCSWTGEFPGTTRCDFDSNSPNPQPGLQWAGQRLAGRRNLCLRTVMLKNTYTRASDQGIIRYNGKHILVSSFQGKISRGMNIIYYYLYSSNAVNLLQFYPFSTLLWNTIALLSLPVNCCCISDQNHKETHFYGDGIPYFKSQTTNMILLSVQND